MQENVNGKNNQAVEVQPLMCTPAKTEQLAKPMGTALQSSKPIHIEDEKPGVFVSSKLTYIKDDEPFFFEI